MIKHTPNETETQFIDAFTSLKNSLISELVERNQPFDTEMWNTYQEIDALITRLYAGEEEIIYSEKQKIDLIT